MMSLSLFYLFKYLNLLIKPHVNSRNLFQIINHNIGKLKLNKKKLFDFSPIKIMITVQIMKPNDKFTFLNNNNS